MKNTRTWIFQQQGQVVGAFSLEDESLSVEKLRQKVNETFGVLPSNIGALSASGDVVLLDSKTALAGVLQQGEFTVIVPVEDAAAEASDSFADAAFAKEVPQDDEGYSSSSSSSSDSSSDSDSDSDYDGDDVQMSHSAEEAVALFVSTFPDEETLAKFLAFVKVKKGKVKKQGLARLLGGDASALGYDEAAQYEMMLLQALSEPDLCVSLYLLGFKPKKLKKAGLFRLAYILKFTAKNKKRKGKSHGPWGHHSRRRFNHHGPPMHHHGPPPMHPMHHGPTPGAHGPPMHHHGPPPMHHGGMPPFGPPPHMMEEEHEESACGPPWRRRGHGRRGRWGRGRGRGGGRGRGRWGGRGHHHHHEKHHKKKECNSKTMARFVKHKTAPDGATMASGQAFTKTWVVRNDSNQPWPGPSTLVPIGGDASLLETKETMIQIFEPLEPGQTCDVTVGPLQAPVLPGRYNASWRLQATTKNGQGKKFGHRLWCEIHSEEQAQQK